MEVVQPPACVRVKVCPAIVIAPLRADPGLLAAMNVTVPLPLPAAPEFTVIHDALLAAVHAHPAGRVTEIALP